MKPTLYYAPWCPDTVPFLAELDKLNVEYEALDMTSIPTNFKAFLKLRDSHKAFDNAKKNGYIGIPALVLENGKVVLDKEQIKTALGLV